MADFVDLCCGNAHTCRRLDLSCAMRYDVLREKYEPGMCVAHRGCSTPVLCSHNGACPHTTNAVALGVREGGNG